MCVLWQKLIFLLLLTECNADESKSEKLFASKRYKDHHFKMSKANSITSFNVC